MERISPCDDYDGTSGHELLKMWRNTYWVVLAVLDLE
jgi:hypothetical protein